MGNEIVFSLSFVDFHVQDPRENHNFRYYRQPLKIIRVLHLNANYLSLEVFMAANAKIPTV